MELKSIFLTTGETTNEQWQVTALLSSKAAQDMGFETRVISGDFHRY